MNRLEYLDGLRGIAALWVLVGHCMLLTGFYFPILGQPHLGVDLFIFLSGFLMVFQYQLRKDREDWNRAATWVGFWIRRFFRLSPLYFCLLIVALLAGKAIYAERVLIDTFFNHPLQQPERYIDASAPNFLLHFTYIFGLIPEYAFRTPLPDWSLGLEMQFYAIFPFVVVLSRRWSWLSAAVAVAIIAACIAGLSYALNISYPMPSFLPLKMHIFLGGMMIAAAEGRKAIYLVLAMLLTALPIGSQEDGIHLLVREIMLIVFYLLVHLRDNHAVGLFAKLLGSSPFYWMGELSYSVYLLHLLILHPMAAWSIRRFGHDLSNGKRFVLVFVIVSAITYPIAYLTYRWIEWPGQRAGKRLLSSLRNRKTLPQVPAEEIAAP